MTSSTHWYTATVVKTKKISAGVKAIYLTIPNWPGHSSGQFCEVKIRSLAGQELIRSYSLAMPPAVCHLELGIELIPSGAVSPYLWQLTPGDTVSIAGPYGDYFVWQPVVDDPLLLIAGGSGLVPLMSIIRQYVQLLPKTKRQPLTIIISAQDKAHLPYWSELQIYQKKWPQYITLAATLTNSNQADWPGQIGRWDVQKLSSFCYSHKQRAYICGSLNFVEQMVDNLVKLGFSARQIYTERF